MEVSTAAIEKICSQSSELAAYLDGELSPREEISLETHLTQCGACRTELNEQKQLLCLLNFAFDDDQDIELPADFTKIVVANAESKVSGLRRPQERSPAFFVCATLFLLSLVGLNGENATIWNAAANFADQVIIVSGFVVRLCYDFAIGAAIILRSVGSRSLFGSPISLTLAIIFFGFSVFALLRLTAPVLKLKIQTQEK